MSFFQAVEVITRFLSSQTEGGIADDSAINNMTPPVTPLEAILPKPFCILSLIGSYILIREIYVKSMQTQQHNKNCCRRCLPQQYTTSTTTATSRAVRRSSSNIRGRRTQLDGPIQRCLLSLSISDIIFSFSFFFTTWPIPRDVNNDIYAFNVGTTATCTAQGFFIEVGSLASPLFNVYLSVLYILLVRYNWTERKLKQIEPWAHGSIWGLSIIFSLVCLGLEFYNPDREACWIAPYARSCPDSRTYGFEDATCNRGENASIAATIHVVVGVVIAFAVNIILFGMLFWTVYRMEIMAMARRWSSIQAPQDSTPGSTTTSDQQPRRTDLRQPDRQRSTSVAVHALLYIAAFLLTYTVDFIEGVWMYYYDKEQPILGSSALLALQGFWNLLIFMRNRQMITPEGQFVKSLFCCKHHQPLCRRFWWRQLSSSTKKPSSSGSTPPDVEVHVPVGNNSSPAEQTEVPSTTESSFAPSNDINDAATVLNIETPPPPPASSTTATTCKLDIDRHDNPSNTTATGKKTLDRDETVESEGTERDVESHSSVMEGNDEEENNPCTTTATTSSHFLSKDFFMIEGRL